MSALIIYGTWVMLILIAMYFKGRNDEERYWLDLLDDAGMKREESERPEKPKDKIVPK